MNFFEFTRDSSAAFISRVVWCVPIGLRGTTAWHWLSLLPSKVKARDRLTGLLSRHEFNRRASSRLRRGGEHTLLYVDIDGLIYANDTLGHVTGDAMLVALARTLRRVASGDLTARYGGDEFVVLVERRQRAEELAKRFRTAVALQFCAERTRTVAARPELAGKPLLTLSVGAAEPIQASHCRNCFSAWTQQWVKPRTRGGIALPGPRPHTSATPQNFKENLLSWHRITLPGTDTTEDAAIGLIEQLEDAYASAGKPAGAEVFHRRRGDGSHEFYLSPLASKIASLLLLRSGAVECSEPAGEGKLVRVRL